MNQSLVIHPKGNVYFVQRTADKIRNVTLERRIVQAVGDIIPHTPPPRMASAVFAGVANQPAGVTPEERNPGQIVQQLLNAGITCDIRTPQGDVTVPAGDGWGYIVYADMPQRIARERQQDTSTSAELGADPNGPYITVHERQQDTATSTEGLHQFIEVALERGILVSIESGGISLFSPEYSERLQAALDPETAGALPRAEVVSSVQQVFKSPAALQSASALLNIEMEEFPPDEQQEPVFQNTKSAIIFQPHLTWQMAATGRYSQFPYDAQLLLTNFGFSRVSFEYDYGVTLELWQDTLSRASRDGAVLIYNQGHGGPDKIYEGSNWRWNGFGTRYFDSRFVLAHAQLPQSMVYVYSCQTLDTPMLRDAFLRKGGQTYCGWRGPAPAYGPLCDQFDSAFWSELFQGRTAQDGLNAINALGLNPVNLPGGQSVFQVAGNPAFKL